MTGKKSCLIKSGNDLKKYYQRPLKAKPKKIEENKTKQKKYQFNLNKLKKSLTLNLTDTLKK